jgi:hypothetical protein
MGYFYRPVSWLKLRERVGASAFGGVLSVIESRFASEEKLDWAKSSSLSMHVAKQPGTSSIVPLV